MRAGETSLLRKIIVLFPTIFPPDRSCGEMSSGIAHVKRKKKKEMMMMADFAYIVVVVMICICARLDESIGKNDGPAVKILLRGDVSVRRTGQGKYAMKEDK